MQMFGLNLDDGLGTQVDPEGQPVGMPVGPPQARTVLVNDGAGIFLVPVELGVQVPPEAVTLVNTADFGVLPVASEHRFWPLQAVPTVIGGGGWFGSASPQYAGEWPQQPAPPQDVASKYTTSALQVIPAAAPQEQLGQVGDPASNPELADCSMVG